MWKAWQLYVSLLLLCHPDLLYNFMYIQPPLHYGTEGRMHKVPGQRFSSGYWSHIGFFAYLRSSPSHLHCYRRNLISCPFSLGHRDVGTGKGSYGRIL